MTTRTRKLLIGAGAFLGILLLVLVLVPTLFGGRIAARVKTEVNQAVDARVDWRDAGLTLFRNFPNLTLRLDDLTIAGVGRFQGDTLASIRHLRVVLDLASAVRSALGGSGPIVVRAVELDRPGVRLIALEDGTANWDIMKERADRKPESERPMSVSLRRFTIDRGVIAFDNRAAKLRATLVGLDQTLTGDFSKDLVDVQTSARVDTATVDFAGITYLNGVRLDLTADIAADMVKKAFTLNDGTGLRINELPLAVRGSITSAAERLGLDLTFGVPKAEFRHILSLEPAVYAKDFQSVRTSGSLALSGRVKGNYGKTDFPAFTLSAKVSDGAFQYPDLPLPARDIALDLGITNPGGDADSTVVNLERVHLVLGRNPVDGRMVLRSPISDPNIDARIAGTVDLADLRRTIKLDRVQELAGTIAADAAVRTRMSWVDAGQYDRVAASGTVDVRNLSVKSEATPLPLSIAEASLALAPRHAELRSFTGTVGSSDLRATGRLDNLLGYLLRDEELRGSATVNSRRFNLDEWRSDEGSLSVIPVPKGIDLRLEANVDRLEYDSIPMTNARGRLHVKDERVTLEDFTFNTLGGSMAISGFYETTTPAKPTFDVSLQIRDLDIPAAFATLTTVQRLAPVAKYASGRFSSELRLTGPLEQNMMPVFAALTGTGSLQTSNLAIRDFPPLERLASATKLAILQDPTMRTITSQFEIRDGRFRTRPFTAQLGPVTMNVAGSNGFDQSLDYDLGIRLPREVIGAEANRAIAGLVSRAAGAGVDLQAAPEIALGVKLTGTITNPSISTNLASAAGDVAGEAAGAVRDAVRDAAEDRVDAATDSARARLEAEAQRLVQEAEARAEQIRAEARTLAERVKAEGNLRADSLAARGGDNPIAQAAARAAADRLRKESDDRSARLVTEADARADSLVAAARRRTSP